MLKSYLLNSYIKYNQIQNAYKNSPIKIELDKQRINEATKQNKQLQQ
jgi:hypothetical protein